MSAVLPRPIMTRGFTAVSTHCMAGPRAWRDRHLAHGLVVQIDGWRVWTRWLGLEISLVRRAGAAVRRGPTALRAGCCAMRLASGSRDTGGAVRATVTEITRPGRCGVRRALETRVDRNIR